MRKDLGYDCAALPGAPVSESVPGWANEDITFDLDGYLVGADNDQNLWRTTVDGVSTVVLPNSGVRAGLRTLWWDGRIASAQYATGAIYLIDPATGSKELLIGSLEAPTGIETGLDESIWFTEIWGERVSRFHLPTGTLTVLAEGYEKAQGISFSPDYDKLYFAAIGEDRIYVMDVDPATMDTISQPRVFAEGTGTSLDGLGVDACGNVYTGSWELANINRWTPDGEGPDVLVNEPNAGHALGNFVWGVEAFGWDPMSIYVVETGAATVRRIELGVPEKPRPSAR